MRRNPEALNRSRARKQKDDVAQRLRDIAPDLASLQLEISEIPVGTPHTPGHAPTAEARDIVSYRKHIIIDRAPARFELPCHDHKCNGAHNITQNVLGALRRKERCIEGSDPCGGETKQGACPYEMQYVIMATYR